MTESLGTEDNTDLNPGGLRFPDLLCSADLFSFESLDL